MTHQHEALVETVPVALGVSLNNACQREALVETVPVALGGSLNNDLS